MIKAVNITKEYRSGEHVTRALQGVSLEIAQGSFVSIVGRSGAGKSTLLYQLSLLDLPTSGTIYLDSVNTETFSNAERTEFRLNRLGYIFQDYALLPELTTVENVILPLLMQGMYERVARGKAEVVLRRLGLAERLGNLPSQLSGGEQQRVSIARAIAHNPVILFADEPTASLDSAMSQTIMDYLLELNREGQTIVMVTHEEEYSSQTERIIELSDGKIISDTPQKKRR